ncbi:hypothetical protein ABMY26_01030 [Azospirillum sp. HJ39]|uniref:hypothetical protein n=1 Tax=Azospirillum sp. HJ39 TaxID=3159496 RepID=UPI0035560107
MTSPAERLPADCTAAIAPRLLAQGRIHAVTRRLPVGGTACSELEGRSRRLGMPSAKRLYRTVFDDAGPSGLFSAELVRLWEKACRMAGGRTPYLLYLHRGQHHDPRLPLLPELLDLLGHRGPVHALRVESRPALSDALAFARAMASRTDAMLLLHDPTRRLAAVNTPDGPLRYLILARGNAPAKAQPSLQTVEV